MESCATHSPDLQLYEAGTVMLSPEKGKTTRNSTEMFSSIIPLRKKCETHNSLINQNMVTMYYI